ncbi:MAG: LuxR C-terminal-related transcriptional regulator [Lapillicoccus sp.]
MGESGRQPLQDLGASAIAEGVYVALVQRGRQGVAGLASWLDEAVPAVEAAVGELDDLGLVEIQDGDVVPLPPRAAIETLAERRSRGAALARESAASLSELWVSHVDSPPYVEMLTTTEAVQSASRTIHDHAVSEVRALSIGPVGRVEIEPTVAPGVLEALRRGVTYRVVYGAQVLQHPLAIAAVNQCIAQGEKARVCRDVPFNLTLGQTYAILMIGAPGAERLHGMVVHPSDLYDRLVAVFDLLWDLGMPISPAEDATGRTPLSPDARRLVTAMAAGLTDESIARELGVSQRTVARRIASLQGTLAVQSRFQLGVMAIRHGWL